MNVLVIGSEGFIGKHLVRYYLKRKLSVFGADLLEAGSSSYHYTKVSRLSPEFDELLQLRTFDFCINASGSGNVPYSVSHPVVDFEANCLDTIRIVDGLRRFNPSCKYLHISSAAVYGNPEKLPVNEADRLSPISPYGWHKLISEQICAEYARIFGLKVAVVRPFSVYGEGLKKQLFWDLFQKWRVAREDGSCVELWGTGMESRDFIHISDFVLALDTIISHGDFQCDIYNVASGVESTIVDAARKFFHAIGGDVKVEFNAKARTGDPQNWSVDIAKIAALGFVPVTTLEEGVLKLVQWLRGLE